MVKFMGFVFVFLYSTVCNAEYLTPEFENPNSSIAMLYMCVVVGEKEGFAEDALMVLAKARIKLDIPIQKSSHLLNDAYYWYEIRKDEMDFLGLWIDLCEVPIDNLRHMSK